MIKKHLTTFENEALYNAFAMSDAFVKPNVSFVKQLAQFIFNKRTNDDPIIPTGEIEPVEPTGQTEPIIPTGETEPVEPTGQTEPTGEPEPVFTINGVEYTDKVITLACGGTYELEGIHEGQIVIDALTTKPDAWTTIRLHNATIISDDRYGILYDCPQSSNKGYQGLNVVLDADTQNFIVCNKANTEVGDETYASIDSWKDLKVQGVGYLAVYNNIGHGLRGETLTLAGPHIYADVRHDAIHGKTINLLDEVLYVQNAKDAVGTNENGYIYVIDGTFVFNNIRQTNFDAKGYGYYINTKFNYLSNYENFMNLTEVLDAGTVIGYNETYPNGIEIIANQIVDKVWEADENQQAVLRTTETVLYNNAYDLSGFTSATVSGLIYAPLVFPAYAVTPTNGDGLDHPEWSAKGKLKSYTADFDLSLDNAYISNTQDCPAILYGPDTGRIKITSIKDSINVVMNRKSNGVNDLDAIKSENNISIEIKNDSLLYVTSLRGDGIDGGDVKITDSKGNLVVTGCGERGIKGSAIVIGPNATITQSTITAYVTDTASADYSVFDGAAIIKNNCKFMEASAGIVTEGDPEVKLTGFADIYARNGKHKKGVFGTTDTELTGVIITGTMGAVVNIDMGNAKNLYYKSTFKVAENVVTPVVEAYKAVPYQGEPIV